MQSQLYPAEWASDSLESLLVTHSRRSRAVYLSVLGLLLAAAALLPLVRVGVSVQAVGIVRPVTEKHDVLARTAGVVETLAATEGRRVREGQLLVRLRTEPLAVRRTRVDAHLEQNLRLVHDLRRLATARSLSAVRPEHLSTPGYRQAYLQLMAEVEEIRLRGRQATREMDRTRMLAERGLVPLRELEDRELALSRLAAEERLLVDRARSGWQSELLEMERTGRELMAEREQVAQESALYRVEAPIAGTIEEMASISPGSYLRAGERVAVISPTGALVAEVYAAPRDIGLVRVGTPARVMVDAFNHNDWGFLTGTVSAISDDYLLVADQPVFRVSIALDRTDLRLKSGVRGELRKGMTLRARFMVAERTLWQLLRDDVDDWLDPVGSARSPA